MAGYGDLRFPLQAVGESFKVLTEKFRWEKNLARDAIVAYMDRIPFLAATEDSVRNAIDLCVDHSVEYWDALMLATAESGGCTALLTEDLQDGRGFAAPGFNRIVQIVNPFNPENRATLCALGLPTD